MKRVFLFLLVASCVAQASASAPVGASCSTIVTKVAYAHPSIRPRVLPLLSAYCQEGKTLAQNPDVSDAAAATVFVTQAQSYAEAEGYDVGGSDGEGRDLIMALAEAAAAGFDSVRHQGE